jgi:hypothetical protein
MEPESHASGASTGRSVAYAASVPIAAGLVATAKCLLVGH